MVTAGIVRTVGGGSAGTSGGGGVGVTGRGARVLSIGLGGGPNVGPGAAHPARMNEAKTAGKVRNIFTA